MAGEAKQKRKRPENLWLFALIGGLMVAIALVAAYILTYQVIVPLVSGGSAHGDHEHLLMQQDDFSGASAVEPPRPMPDFTLTDQDGDSVSLSDLQGKPVLMFFGFTNCPDVCPLTLNDFHLIRQDLGPDTRDAAHYVFISVDGERDTPETIRRYLQQRGVDDFVIGLTGSPDEIRRLGADYGLRFEYGEANADGDYNVDHTARTYLLDAEGRWIMQYAFGTDRTEIKDDLETLLAGELPTN